MGLRLAAGRNSSKGIPQTISMVFLTVSLVLGGAQEARAVRPLYSPLATVAGDEMHPGFRDGSFNTALFNRPLGLAVSADGTRLFVADAGNNRIRVIHLDQNNEVTTLAGQDGAGKLDGPLTLAQFFDPRGVLYLPDDRLVVNDFGNQVLRFVDLKAGTVTTFTGGPAYPAAPDSLSSSPTPSPTPQQPVLLGGIKDMAYLPGADSIFFTQPDSGSLKALNLGTGLVSTVLDKNAQIPNPSALWIQGDKLYVADRDLPKVYGMDWKDKAVTNLSPAGTPLDKVLSLCSSDNILYGLLGSAGHPAERFILDGRYTHEVNVSNQLVTFINGWGDSVAPDKYFAGPPQAYSPWMGFVPDPLDNRKFFVSEPEYETIVSLRDLFITGGDNSNGLFDPEYPAQKSKNTYRVLLVGDSRVLEAQPFPFASESHPLMTPPNQPAWAPSLTIAPQVERELNFQAALEDVPLNYEFLNFGRHGDLLFWPTIDVPAAVQRNDIDLVVIFSPNIDRRAFYYYYDHNLTPDGIPQYPPDMEYLLKPPLERIPEGLPRKFYDYCKAHDLVKVDGRNLVFDESVMTNPETRQWVLDFYGKPWDVLNRKLSAMKTSGGKPVRLLILFTYTGREGSQKYQPDFYEEVAKKYNIPFFDMDPVMNALHLSFYPLTGDGSHLNPDGCVFFGKLLAHELAREKLIPWKDDPPQ